MNEITGLPSGAAVDGGQRAMPGTRVSAAISMLLGALIIYGAGFAPGILHGNSHDSRHTLGFPCH
jgi:cobalt transporter subunit CbtB